jgi:hypothetical protein
MVRLVHVPLVPLLDGVELTRLSFNGGGYLGPPPGRRTAVEYSNADDKLRRGQAVSAKRPPDKTRYDWHGASSHRGGAGRLDTTTRHQRARRSVHRPGQPGMDEAERKPPVYGWARWTRGGAPPG